MAVVHNTTKRISLHLYSTITYKNTNKNYLRHYLYAKSNPNITSELKQKYAGVTSSDFEFQSKIFNRLGCKNNPLIYFVDCFVISAELIETIFELLIYRFRDIVRLYEKYYMATCYIVLARNKWFERSRLRVLQLSNLFRLQFTPIS